MPVCQTVTLGNDVVIFHPELVNLYGCRIGDESQIGPFVEIQKRVEIGRRCKISSHSFLCEGVTMGDGVFVGHGVMFTNVALPRATTPQGRLQGAEDWDCIPTRIEDGASIGSGSVILCGITIGEQALVGAGAVVTRDVPPFAVVVGSPARVIGDVRDRKESGS